VQALACVSVVLSLAVDAVVDRSTDSQSHEADASEEPDGSSSVRIRSTRITIRNKSAVDRIATSNLE
jgi:hypothetical protein